MFKPVIIKGMLWNGEFFLGRFPTELSFVKKGNHRVVTLPALVLDNEFVFKEVDAEETNKLLPNAMITSPYNINFEGANYGEDDRQPLFLNNKEPFTKEDQQKIMEAFKTLHTFGLMNI
jgi:hypothetical protein